MNPTFFMEYIHICVKNKIQERFGKIMVRLLPKILTEMSYGFLMVKPSRMYFMLNKRKYLGSEIKATNLFLIAIENT